MLSSVVAASPQLDESSGLIRHAVVSSDELSGLIRHPAALLDESLELIRQRTTALTGPPVPRTAADELRAAIRYRFNFNRRVICSLNLPGDDSRYSVGVLDVSAAGIGLRVDRSLEPGALAFLSVHNKARGQVRVLLLRVQRVTQLPCGGYLIGGAFTKRLNFDELWDAFFKMVRASRSNNAPLERPVSTDKPALTLRERLARLKT